jgi:hypothetical protein
MNMGDRARRSHVLMRRWLQRHESAMAGCMTTRLRLHGSEASRRASSKDALGRIVDAAIGCDDAESSYYEAAADPSFVLLERARRQFRGQYIRRLRRRANRHREGRT